MRPIMKLLSIFSCLFWIANAAISVDTESRHFVDESNRVRIFHGVNVVYKIAPYYPRLDKFTPQTSLTTEDIENLYEWGFNFVRLGTMWPGLQPEPTTFNSTYVNILEQIVNELGKKEIYSLLDMHQDLLSPKFCGEGAPDWAITVTNKLLPFPYPALLHELPIDPKTGYPDINACLEYTFARFYFAMATGSAFQSLYDNVNNVQHYLGDMWEFVAKKFTNNSNVVGYELINEPWPGDIYAHPDLALEAGKADSEHLQPMYDYLGSRIRNVDNQHIIFYEMALTDNIHIKAGFTHVPGGDVFNNRSVFSYHIYCGNTDRNGEPSNEFLCDATSELSWDMYGHLIAVLTIGRALANVQRIGGGGMMTEWGNMPNNTIDIDEINWFANTADRKLQSWSWWQFKSYHDITTSGVGTSESFYDADGNLMINKVKALSRTYAYAIAGMPVSMAFDPTTANFVLNYKVNTKANKPTEIYLNKKWFYANGYQVKINPDNAATWKELALNRISVTHSGQVQNGSLLQVIITPK